MLPNPPPYLASLPRGPHPHLGSAEALLFWVAAMSPTPELPSSGSPSPRTGLRWPRAAASRSSALPNSAQQLLPSQPVVLGPRQSQQVGEASCACHQEWFPGGRCWHRRQIHSTSIPAVVPRSCLNTAQWAHGALSTCIAHLGVSLVVEAVSEHSCADALELNSQGCRLKASQPPPDSCWLPRHW